MYIHYEILLTVKITYGMMKSLKEAVFVDGNAAD